jgi:hypothetical protein
MAKEKLRCWVWSAYLLVTPDNYFLQKSVPFSLKLVYKVTGRGKVTSVHYFKVLGLGPAVILHLS